MRDALIAPVAVSALTATTLAFLLAAPGQSLGQSISVSVPRVSVTFPQVSIHTPRISVDVPHVSVDAAVSQATASVTRTASQISADVAAMTRQVASDAGRVPTHFENATAAVPNATDVVGASLGQEIAADTAAAVAAITSGAARAHRSADRGLAALVGPGGVTELVQVRTSAIAMASGTAVAVDFYGDGLINFVVDNAMLAPAAGGNASGQGKVINDGDAITITASTANSVVDRAINMSGFVESQSIALRDGQIALVAGGGVSEVTSPSHSQPDPVAAVLAEAEFLPARYAASGGIHYSDSRVSAHTLRPAHEWSRGNGLLFGMIGHGPTSLSDDPEAATLPSQLRSGSLLAGIDIRLGSGDDEELEQALQASLAAIEQIETMVADDRPLAADDCSRAGGGIGTPGCGAGAGFGISVRLQPDETGSGCTLVPSGSGVRLACGGAFQTAPTSSEPVHLPPPAIDSTVTLKDLLKIWLLPPDPSSLPLALGNDERMELADAGRAYGAPQ